MSLLPVFASNLPLIRCPRLALEHYKEAYPDAKVIGPEDLPKKKKLEFTLDAGE